MPLIFGTTRLLVESDRVAGIRDNGNDLWLSQKHKSFGGNVQFLAAPDVTPLWVSDVDRAPLRTSPPPGCTSCPRCTRQQPTACPPLADKGYTCAGIRVPVRRPRGTSERALDVDTRTTNTLIRDLRALGERTTAELMERWRTLKHITVSPCRIGDTARAALVLNGHWQ
ncbi:transposase family protein [Streptomyces sp. YPW6]|uniref:transposase family protein n=1 Tax=Streptomyces sp. YPW6 TaxID=2840373 RepID=UPI003D71D54F